MSNIASFSLSYLVGVSQEQLIKCFPAESQLISLQPEIFNQMIVKEYRALAAFYYNALHNYERWCDVPVYMREAPNALKEYECSVMLDDIPLSGYLGSRGQTEFREFINVAVDRHNALAQAVFGTLSCGLPYEAFKVLTELMPVTPNLVARSLLYYSVVKARTYTWYNNEVLDLNIDRMLCMDRELQLRIRLLTGVPLSKFTIKPELQEELTRYLKGVFIGPIELAEYKRVFALKDECGLLTQPLQDYVEASGNNGIVVTPLSRQDLKSCGEGDFVISDDHMFVSWQCTYQKSVHFGGLAPIESKLYNRWVGRANPNMFIVNRYAAV